MGTRSVFVCDVCGLDVPAAVHKIRLSIKDASDPMDVRELRGSAVEPCPTCLPAAAASKLATCLEHAGETKRGWVATWSVAVDVIPLTGATSAAPVITTPGNDVDQVDGARALEAPPT